MEVGNEFLMISWKNESDMDSCSTWYAGINGVEVVTIGGCKQWL